jgi:hypothetical protein
MKLNARVQNNVVTDQVSNLNAYDLNTQYNLISSKKLNIHTIQGLGYTSRSAGPTADYWTVQTGLGLNVQMNRAWSVSAQSQAKWGLKDIDGGSSYLQHSLSLNYTLDGWNTFGRYSRTGSVVNLYKALDLAEKRYGK